MVTCAYAYLYVSSHCFILVIYFFVKPFIRDNANIGIAKNVVWSVNGAVLNKIMICF